jgi:hypothetical protein
MMMLISMLWVAVQHNMARACTVKHVLNQITATAAVNANSRKLKLCSMVTLKASERTQGPLIASSHSTATANAAAARQVRANLRKKLRMFQPTGSS